MLDLLVGGCKVLLCLATAVNPSQPDVPAGASVCPITLGAGNVAVGQCAGDAYSAAFHFTTDRVIIK